MSAALLYPFIIVAGALQALVEDHVVEGDREAPRQQGDQRAVGVGERAVGVDQRDDLAAARGLDVERGETVAEAVAARGEGLLDQGLDAGIERPAGIAADIAAVEPGTRQHAEATLRPAFGAAFGSAPGATLGRPIGSGRRPVAGLPLVLAQDEDAGAIDVEERGDLGQHAFGEPLHRLVVEQHRRGVDDDLQAPPGLVEPPELLVGPQGRGEAGEKLVGGEFGLRLVVVDVVIDDDAPLRRLPRLAGAQDDPDGLLLQLPADVIDELEAGIVGLHHHVEQHDGDVAPLGQQRPGLLARMGREDVEPTPVEAVAGERVAGALVDGRIVVDHGDRPGAGAARRLRGLVGNQFEPVVVHRVKAFPRSSSSSARIRRSLQRNGRPPAVLGAAAGAAVRFESTHRDA